MEITKIKVDQISPKESGICGEFSVTFDDLLVIHKILVINGRNGLFIAFPNNGEAFEVNQKKRYCDIAHPTTQIFRKSIEEEVLKKYHECISNF